MSVLTSVMRIGLGVLAVCGVMAAQEQQIPTPTFQGGVSIVVAPVTVTRDGSFVNGLEARNFKLLDNGKEQDIKLDVTYVPISLVLAVQCSSNAQVFLPTIKRIGPLIEGLVVGQQGEAALLAFDHRMRTIQDFTNDGRLLSKGLESLNAGSSSHAMIDAVFAGTRLLRNRPKGNRRVMLLVSETIDRGSEGRMREALLEAQIHNVQIYTVNINRLITSLTDKGQPPRFDPYAPGQRARIPGQPMNATTNQTAFGIGGNAANFTPLLIELFRQTKAIFFDNPAEVFTKYTGGKEYSFINQSTLERVIGEIGEDLHSQYLLSYNPNNQNEGGWHEIEVITLPNKHEVRTRPGYWMAARPDGR